MTAKRFGSKRWLAVLATALVAACSPATPSTTPAQSPTPSAATTPTAGPSGAPTDDPETARPADWADLLERRVAAGTWTMDQGLLELLRGLAGATEMPALDDQERVSRGAASGVVRRARQFIAANPSAGATPELARLLAVVLPDRASLDEIAEPSGRPAAVVGRQPGAGSQGIAYAASVDIAQDPPLGCRSVRPTAGVEDPGTCMVYDERSAAGASIRVYYPRAWRADFGRHPFFDLALDGTSHAVEVFTGLGLRTGPTIDVVFTMFPMRADPDVLASADAVGAGCGVRVYPAAYDEWVGAPARGDRIRQLLAHEVFHCFQFWNFEAAMAAPAAASEWWVEGSAEFFGNVAYPAANIEHDWTDEAQATQAAGLFTRGYENVFWFQQLANTVGAEGVFSVIRAMPSSGTRDDQKAALAASPGIEELHHEYGQALVDRAIDDQGRGPHPVEPTIAVLNASDVGLITSFRVKEFAVFSYSVAFAERRAYTLETGFSGDGNQSVHDLAGGEWADPPETVIVDCTPQGFAWVVTAASTSASEYTNEVTAVEERECNETDDCLVGTWDLDNTTYEAFVTVHEGSTFEGATGRMYAAYTDSGVFAGGFDAFTISISSDTQHPVTGAPVTQIVDLELNGRADGTYTSTGEALIITRSDYDFGAVVRIIYDGEVISVQDVPFQSSSLPVVFEVAMPYVCSETELRFPTVIGERDFTNLVFRRSSVPLP